VNIDLSRRLFLFGGAAVAGLFIVGCGDDNEPSASSALPTTVAGAAFPRTIKHPLGTTTIAAKPTRIVVLGYSEADVAVALGATPVALQKIAFFGIQDITPWLRAKLGATNPDLIDLSGGINFERVAALKPDLILAGTANTIDADYQSLSRIAPTLPYTTGWYKDTWQQQTTDIATAIGRDAEANRLSLTPKPSSPPLPVATPPGEAAASSAQRPLHRRPTPRRVRRAVPDTTLASLHRHRTRATHPRNPEMTRLRQYVIRT
jgi:ABC-type Fe3+-citrate transport system substrate-binding protein